MHGQACWSLFDNLQTAFASDTLINSLYGLEGDPLSHHCHGAHGSHDCKHMHQQDRNSMLSCLIAVRHMCTVSLVLSYCSEAHVHGQSCHAHTSKPASYQTCKLSKGSRHADAQPDLHALHASVICKQEFSRHKSRACCICRRSLWLCITTTKGCDMRQAEEDSKSSKQQQQQHTECLLLSSLAKSRGAFWKQLLALGSPHSRPSLDPTLSRMTDFPFLQPQMQVPNGSVGHSADILSLAQCDSPCTTSSCHWSCAHSRSARCLLHADLHCCQ